MQSKEKEICGNRQGMHTALTKDGQLRGVEHWLTDRGVEVRKTVRAVLCRLKL